MATEMVEWRTQRPLRLLLHGASSAGPAEVGPGWDTGRRSPQCGCRTVWSSPVERNVDGRRTPARSVREPYRAVEETKVRLCRCTGKFGRLAIRPMVRTDGILEAFHVKHHPAEYSGRRTFGPGVRTRVVKRAQVWGRHPAVCARTVESRNVRFVNNFVSPK